jgi:hypothetical protein
LKICCADGQKDNIVTQNKMQKTKLYLLALLNESYIAVVIIIECYLQNIIHVLIVFKFWSDVGFFFFGLWGYWHCGHSWPIVSASGDSEDDCGEADGM